MYFFYKCYNVKVFNSNNYALKGFIGINYDEKIYELGEIPELGVIPDEMYAWVIREERLGVPEKAMRDRKNARAETRER